MVKSFVVGFFRAISRAIMFIAATAWHGSVQLAKVTWRFVLQYLELVNKFTGAGTQGLSDGSREVHWSVRYAVRGILWCFAPVVLLIMPVGLIVILTAILMAIDQVSYPTFPVSDVFTKIDQTPADGQSPTVEDIGSALFTVTYHQLDMELHAYTWGWTANDSLGLQFFDNRINRELGVRHASIELLNVLVANISKFGSVDAEDPRLTYVRQSGITYDPTASSLSTYPWVEQRYNESINNIKLYQADMRAHKAGVRVNVTNADIVTILDAVGGRILEVPRGRLTKSNEEVSWFTLDDDVFFAQGAAIVARDTLVVIKNGFGVKIAERGALENLNRAIDALEGVLKFHPYVTERGEGDSPFADHRAKLNRYYGEAIARIKDVAEALRG